MLLYRMLRALGYDRVRWVVDWADHVWVEVRLGDSLFPVSAGSGGQWGANSSTAGVYAACSKLRENATVGLPRSALVAVTVPKSPLAFCAALRLSRLLGRWW